MDSYGGKPYPQMVQTSGGRAQPTTPYALLLQNEGGEAIIYNSLKSVDTIVDAESLTLAAQGKPSGYIDAELMSAILLRKYRARFAGRPIYFCNHVNDQGAAASIPL